METQIIIMGNNYHGYGHHGYSSLNFFCSLKKICNLDL